MSVDRFAVDLGLVQVEQDATPAALEALRTGAKDFFRAGGVLAWSEWRDMGEATRQAFVAARDEIEIERMASLAYFMSARLPTAAHGQPVGTTQARNGPAHGQEVGGQ